MGNRRRSSLFASGFKMPEGWHYANEAPNNNAYLALWYKNKIFAVELNGYWDTSDEELTSGIMGILIVPIYNVNSPTERYVISDEDYANALPWGTSGLLADVNTATSATSASNDWNAANNTFNIFKNGGANSSASVHCINRSFLNGSPSLLMSGGYFLHLSNYRTAVNGIIAKFGLGALSTSLYYWTSTQATASAAWRGRMGSGLSSATKTTNNRIRRMMLLPKDGGKFIPINFEYNGDWTNDLGYRKSPEQSSSNQSSLEKVVITNNTNYQKVRIYAYCEGYMSYIDIGILNEDWSITGGWSRRIYGYEATRENPVIVDFYIPNNGENFVDMRMFSSSAADRGYYKIVNVDEIPKLVNTTYSGNIDTDHTSNGFHILYGFYAGSYTGRITMIAPKRTMVRLYYFPLTTNSGNVKFLLGKLNEVVTETNFDRLITGSNLPPNHVNFIDFALEEGENFIELLIRVTINNNNYMFVKIEELLDEPGFTIHYQNEWSKSVDGYYYSPPTTSGQGADTATTANIYTDKDNTVIKISYYASTSSSNYFYIGKLDIALTTSNYNSRTSGTSRNEENPLVGNITIPKKGSHFIDIAYLKTSATVAGDDRGYFKIEQITE